MNDELYEEKDFIILGSFGGENQSGFGIVYLLLFSNNMMLAAKTLQGTDMSLSKFEEFKKEAIPWIKLARHPFIVNAVSIELFEDKPYLLMEPILPDEKGRQSLKDFLDVNLELYEILKWSIQFCHAMEYINSKNIIHGDIKPENILIFQDNVKVTDFGLTENLNEINGVNGGSYPYLAPEAWDGCKSISSEIYSFGMVLYQMVNGGDLPFNGLEDGGWENFHKNSTIPKLDSILYSIISKCLEKNPKNRYSSFKEIIGELNLIFKDKFNQKIEIPKMSDFGYIEDMCLGHSYAILGDKLNAKKYYEKAINDSSQDNLTIFNFALDLIFLEDYELALLYLNKLCDVDEFENVLLSKIYFNIGLCYQEQKKLYLSIFYYNKSIHENINNLKAHVNLGNVYREYGLFHWAFDQYNFVLNQDEYFEEALINMALLFDKMGDVDKSKIYLDKLDKLKNKLNVYFHKGIFFKNIDLLNYLTTITNCSKYWKYQILSLISSMDFHLENNNVDEANKIFNEILEISNDAELLISLALHYNEQGFNEEAIKKLNFVAEKYADYKADCIHAKSLILKDNSINEAIKLNNLLLTFDISDSFKSDVYSNLGSFSTGDVAIGYYEKSLKYNEKNITTYLNLIVNNLNNGFIDNAEKYVNKALIIDSNNYELLFFKAEISLLKKEIENALYFYNECLKQYPTVDAYFKIATSFGLLGEFNLSFFYIMLAFNINMDDSNVLICHLLYSLIVENEKLN